MNNSIDIEIDEETTLSEGLRIFYQKYQDRFQRDQDKLPEDVKNFFMSHDIAHVLFGCDISLFGEGSLKLWTLFGTTLSFSDHIRGYRKASAFELSMKFKLRKAFPDLLKLLLTAPILMVRAARMRQPWPWDDFEPYLNTSISRIREEFNIRITK